MTLPMNNAMRLFIKFIAYVKPYRKKQALVFILSSIGVLLSLASPYLSKLIIDKAFIQSNLKVFIVLTFIAAVIFLLNSLIRGLASLLLRHAYFKVRLDLSRAVFGHLQQLSWDFFQNKSTGEHLFKMNYDIENSADFVSSLPNDVLTLLSRFVGILAIIVYLNWQMALSSFLLIPVLAAPVSYFTRRRRTILKELLADAQNIFKRLCEVFSHMYLVKALSQEERETKSYLEALINNTKIRIRNMHLDMLSGFSSNTLTRVVTGLIMFFGGYQVIKARMSLGTLTAMTIYLGQLINVQSSILSLYQKISLGLVSCQRLDEILAQTPKVIEKEQAISIILKEAKIEFQKVSFGYNPGEYVLNAADFVMDKGVMALAGPSGCGKTTIVNLILRLYDPWQGRIIIDGYDIKEVGLSSLRKQIGVALQEPFLWNDTVENNIKYAKEDASKQEFLEAARIAGVEEFVKTLPQGYATNIGENACRISEGQKQRIAIARAVIKKPKILILDEALSSVDVELEERIIYNIRSSLKESSVIVVSHRLSTIHKADAIYFLSAKNRIEKARHEELLQHNARYRTYLACAPQ